MLRSALLTRSRCENVDCEQFPLHAVRFLCSRPVERERDRRRKSIQISFRLLYISQMLHRVCSSLSLSLSSSRAETLCLIQCQSRFSVNSIGRSFATLSFRFSAFSLEHRRKLRKIEREIFYLSFVYKLQKQLYIPLNSFHVKLVQ